MTCGIDNEQKTWYNNTIGTRGVSVGSVIGPMIVGGAIGCAVSFRGNVARTALSGALIGLIVGLIILRVMKFITRTFDDAEEIKTVQIRDDDLKKWFEAGLLREISFYRKT